MINPLVSTLIKGMLYLILKAKQGGKYLSRKQVIDKRTGRKTWKYKYKPVQQRAAHEVTRNKFEKVTKLSGDEHKNQIEHALQNGIRVSLHVLKDYPDLITKYNQQARMAKAEKIRAKVKASKEKERMEREVRLNTPEGLKNNPIKLEAERMMREDGLIKDVPVSDNREVENNFDTMPESKPEPATKLVNKTTPKQKQKLPQTPKEKKFYGIVRKQIHQDLINQGIKITPEQAKVLSQIDFIEKFGKMDTNKNPWKLAHALLNAGLFNKTTRKFEVSENFNHDKISDWKRAKLVEPAAEIKVPDLKANFEAWKEERKAPAFKLEQEDLTSKEKNTRFNDAQGGLFGKKPTTHESYAKKDLKPTLALEGNETITSLVTAVKSALMSEGLDTRAREFVDKAFKEKDLVSLKKLASEYVDMKESVQVLKPTADDKGSEGKKMDTSVNEAKKQELLEIGDLLIADNKSPTWNTFSNSEKARNKDLFASRINKFLPKIQTTVSAENVSPKQISYAEAAKYSNIDSVRTTFKNKLVSSKSKEEFIKTLDHMVRLDTLLNSKTDTLWWLKNKDMGYKSYQELQKMFPNTLK